MSETHAVGAVSGERCELTDLITWMCAHCRGHETEWVDQFLKDEDG